MPTINQTVSGGTSDGNAGTGSGYNNNGGTVIVGGYFGTANGWWLFPTTGIPEGASISAATFTATKGGSAAGTANLTWSANLSTAPAYPTSTSDYNSKTITSATVNHNGQSGAGGSYTSPSLVSVIQEVVNQSGFNGTIQLFCKDNASNATYGGFENRIEFKAVDGGGSGWGTLNVTYAGAPITADKGTFTLTGVAANLPVSYKIAADAATFTLSGIAAGIKVSENLPCAVDSFTLTGIAATTATNSVVAVGAFTLSGIDAGVSYNSPIVSDVGAFTLTGFDANFSPTITFTCDGAGANQLDNIIATNWLGTGSGYYVLDINSFGNSTANISWNGTTPADLVSATQSAIDTLIGAGNCNVTLHDPSGPVFIRLEFIGDYARREIYCQVAVSAPPSGSVLRSPVTTAAPAFVLSGIDARVGVDYTDVADVAAFVLTGIDASVTLTATLDSDPAAFVLTGIAAPVVVGIDIDPGAFTLSVNFIRFNENWYTYLAPGAYTLSGIDAESVRKLPVSAGAFTLAGQDAGIEYNSLFDIDARAFTFTGAALGFGTGAVLSCSAGTFTLTGIAAGYAGVYTIDADPNAFVFSGIAATFSGVTFAPIPADAGAYVLGGIGAAITAGPKITGEKATYHLTGIAAGILRADATAAAVGAFALTGKVAFLGYATAQPAELGEFALAGQAAATRVGLRGGAAAFVVTRNPANLPAARSIGAGIGTYTLTGNSNAFRFPLVAVSGSYSLLGQDANPRLSATVNCAGAFGLYSFVGRAATIGHAQFITADNTAFTLTGIDAGVLQRAVIDSDNATFALSGIDAGWRTVAILVCAPATFAVAGQAAALTWMPLVFGIEAYAEINGQYSGAVHVSGSYSNTCEVSGSYSARVTLNSVDTVNNSFWISEPNDVWLRYYKKASDGIVQSGDAPTFSLIDPATDLAVGGIEDEAMTCTDVVNGHYLGVAAPVDSPTITRDADYILRISVSGKVYRELQVTAKVRGSL